jgi:hypothetical protein
MGITRRSATAREIKVRLRKLTARVPFTSAPTGNWLGAAQCRQAYRGVCGAPRGLALLASRGWQLEFLPVIGHWSASNLSTAIPVPIAASRKLALPIFSSMRLAPNSATLGRIPMMLFFVRLSPLLRDPPLRGPFPVLRDRAYKFGVQKRFRLRGGQSACKPSGVCAPEVRRCIAVGYPALLISTWPLFGSIMFKRTGKGD